jgi:ribokinase
MAVDQSVTVVGSMNMDHVVRVRTLPAPGATVAAWSYLRVAGGKGLNQAVTAVRQGAAVQMVGCVGQDPAGWTLTDLLDAEGIESTGVRRVGDEATGLALVTVADGGDNTVVVAAGANGRLAPSDLPPGLARGSAVLLAQLEIPLETVQRALEVGRAAGAFTILNPAPASGPLPSDVLTLVDLLVPNETEATALMGSGAGAATPQEAAQALARAGCGAVIVTLGARGAVLFRDLEVIDLAPFPVDAVDTTAAGDAFCGALAAALAQGATLLDAARRASAAGALATSRVGAVPSLPTLADVERLLGRGVE